MVALIVPLLEGTFRNFRQEGVSVGLKAESSFSKAGRRSVAMLARYEGRDRSRKTIAIG
jgi:hypothetical protein